jgi:predicted O-methyltransferase YrrM
MVNAVEYKKYERMMLQDPGEFNEFLRIIREQNVRSYLEIGSKHGGTFWKIATVLPPGSRVVSVDLPHGDGSFKESEPHLVACINELNRRGYDAHLFIGDSTDPDVIRDVAKLGPFDLCFIDANHTEPFVRSDWKHYGQMARIVAFHDIGWQKRPEPSKKMPIDVPHVWGEIKQGFRYQEIRRCPRDNGIGIIWRS